jgi:hypothetical protein
MEPVTLRLDLRIEAAPRNPLADWNVVYRGGSASEV